MATETTKDAVIDTGTVPDDQQANLNVFTSPTGTVITNTGVVDDLNASVSGNVTVAGGTFQDATFSFTTSSSGTPPAVAIRNTKLTGTTVTGGSTPDSWTQGGNTASAKHKATTKTKDTNAIFGEGADSVSFLKKSLDKDSTYSMGAGADSITFGKNSATKFGKVKLGSNDGDGDNVDIHKKAEVKKLKITEFDKEDKLKIGGKTFSYNDLQDKDFKNITIKFD
ncbi:hypothetical protein [Vulcanococcus sp.]|uniref:hypothetical protein n=1 Tax=Vulcanococcus sp. TaxID=2856995 RepID=UPI003F69726D